MNNTEIDSRIEELLANVKAMPEEALFDLVLDGCSCCSSHTGGNNNCSK